MKNTSLFIALMLFFAIHPAYLFSYLIPWENRSDSINKDTTAYQLHLVNNTSYEVDGVIRWTCNYLNLKNITICVAFQPKYFKEDAFVLKQDDIYYIYLKQKVSNLSLVLIHEMIHIKQYETGVLSIYDYFRVKFKGATINLKKTDYAQRNFEIEAHKQDSKILQEYLHFKRSLITLKKEETALGSNCSSTAAFEGKL